MTSSTTASTTIYNISIEEGRPVTISCTAYASEPPYKVFLKIEGNLYPVLRSIDHPAGIVFLSSYRSSKTEGNSTELNIVLMVSANRTAIYVHCCYTTATCCREEYLLGNFITYITSMYYFVTVEVPLSLYSHWG